MLQCLFFLLFSFGALCADSPFEATKDLPAAYQGRFRSLDSASRLWLYDTYHKQQLKTDDLSLFNTNEASALSLMWQVHFFGHSNWADAPFFWVHYATVKKHLDLDPNKDRFSFNSLYPLIISSSAPFNAAEKPAADELTKLHDQLQLFSGYEGSSDQFQKTFEDFYAELQKKGMASNEIAHSLEIRFPFIQRLQTSGNMLKMLPAKQAPGEWVSLNAFKTKIYDQKSKRLIPSNNFTSFSNQHFLSLRNAYLALEKAVLDKQNSNEIGEAARNFTAHYHAAYESLAGIAYRPAQDKALSYPTQRRLQAETLYYRLPLIETTLFLYALALILMLTQSKRKSLGPLALTALLIGFVVHTTVLVFRCYILERPPVSNMFETVVYVPWVSVAIGLVFYWATRSRLILAAAVVASFALLVLLKLTQVDSRLENVQAVLDSQYWLIIHVLMVVGSYGAFAICGILGHFYLINFAWSKWKPERFNAMELADRHSKIAQGILHTMYVGVALLIPGTILGGVWAAESWGRFWDWDPKESWAFISACIYILFIHAYTFHHIRDFGLAIGAVAGLVAISFTWYGVNYILGTGLHSYGFGNGGESVYFLYVAAECLFIFFMGLLKIKARNSLKKIR